MNIIYNFYVQMSVSLNATNVRREKQKATKKKDCVVYYRTLVHLT